VQKKDAETAWIAAQKEGKNFVRRKKLKDMAASGAATVERAIRRLWKCSL
jgi:hypothetical protein